MNRRGDPVWTSVLASVIVLLFVSAGYSADGLAIVKDGNASGAPACSSCHGVRGEGSPENGYPRLAGLVPEYLIRQLNSFADGSRDSDIMSMVAKSLTADERRAVADYYALQNPPIVDASAQDVTLVAHGQAIAKVGLWEKGVPGCAQCHAGDGQGVGSAFPRIAGQSAKYIEDQLDAFREGKRHNDPMHLMTGIASKLVADDSKAVATYYASLTSISGERGRP